MAAPSPSPVPNSIGIRLLEAPVNRAADPRAKSYIVDHVAPGTVVQRKIEVTNGTAVPQHVLLYGGSASIGPDGWIAAGGRGGNDLADWISVNPPALDVAPGKAANATVSIAVPATASTGERYAVVWAQPPTTPGQVALVNLVGIRVYLSVGPGGEPVTDFAIESLAARRDNGAPRILAHVRNTGARALDLAGQVVLSGGPGSLSAGPFSAKGFTLGVGESGDTVFALDPAIPPGAWDVAATLSSGQLQHTAQARVDIPTVSESPVAPVAAHPVVKPSRSLLAPGAIGLGVALLIGGFLVARSRRRVNHKGKHSA